MKRWLWAQCVLLLTWNKNTSAYFGRLVSPSCMPQRGRFANRPYTNDKAKLMYLYAGLIVCTLLLAACGHTDNHGFDPQADPFAQVESAKGRAQSEQKKILIIAGGAWCHWCRALDTFIHARDALKTNFDAAFVTVKVYSGDEKDNDAFFSTLPEAPGVPHFWVLDQHGALLASQGTDVFETGTDQYSEEQLLSFARQWLQHGASP